MRGRIIFPFLAELYRLDTQAMAADPDAAGPLTSGFDPDFHEPVVLDTGVDFRRELPPVRVRCQVEPLVYEELLQTAAGNAPRSKLVLVFHYRDLERAGLVDTTTGDAQLRAGDRLSGLFDVVGDPVQLVRTPPGLYVTEARPSGFGLGRRRPARNLLLVSFEDRPQAARRGA